MAPGKWETQRASLARLGSDEDVVAIAGIVPVSASGEGAPVSSTAEGPFRCDGLTELFERVRIRAFLNTYVVPTALMRRIGGYDPRLIWGEHTDVLIRLSQVARFVGVDHISVRVHRAHEADETRVGRDEALRADGIALLLEKHADAFARAPGTLARYEEVLGVTLLRLGRRRGSDPNVLPDHAPTRRRRSATPRGWPNHHRGRRSGGRWGPHARRRLEEPAA